MDVDKKLELLTKIQKVEAPPFLLTRVLARIDVRAVENAPATWKLAFITATLAVLVLNISVLIKASDKPKEKGIAEVVHSMGLSNTNDLYHE